MSKIEPIKTIDELEAIYEAAVPLSLTKVARQITPLYRQWIEASKFCVLTTVGPEGTDGTPRGDDGPVVRIMDQHTLAMPDWRGNNRLDSLRNIVRDDRVSLMFMVPANSNVVRVNGRAIVTADADLLGQFEQGGKHPKTVILITIEELYFQCAKAILRSKLWSDDTAYDVPKAGQFLREMQDGFDAEAYDDNYATYAKDRMW